MSRAAYSDLGTPRGGRRTVPSRTPSSGLRGLPRRTMRMDMAILRILTGRFESPVSASVAVTTSSLSDCSRHGPLQPHDECVESDKHPAASCDDDGTPSRTQSPTDNPRGLQYELLAHAIRAASLRPDPCASA